MAECAPEEDKTEKPQEETAQDGKPKTERSNAPFLNNAHQAHPFPRAANHLKLSLTQRSKSRSRWCGRRTTTM